MCDKKTINARRSFQEVHYVTIKKKKKINKNVRLFHVNCTVVCFQD